MPIYIDADQMLEDFKELHGRENDLLNCYNADWIESFIEGRPTVDVQEVRYGEWIESDYGICHCSECGFEYKSQAEVTQYCPGCGARMDGAT